MRDNWDICPKCAIIAARNQKAAEEKLASDYGQIPAPEWLKQKGRMEREANKSLGETLAEDCDFAISETGIFSIIYRAKCDRCGLKFEFKHEEMIEMGENV